MSFQPVSRTFFILSLPRCRTAWLANFLTYEDSYCFHEGLLNVGQIRDLRGLFERTGKSIVGNSDCGNILFLDQIVNEFPDTRFVMVERETDSVLSELDEMDGFSDVETILRGAELLKWAKEVYKPMVVDYWDMGKETCRSIWDYCIGTEFDETRWEMLDGIDMQIIPDKKVKQMIKHRNNIESLMQGVH